MDQDQLIGPSIPMGPMGHGSDVIPQALHVRRASSSKGHALQANAGNTFLATSFKNRNNNNSFNAFSNVNGAIFDVNNGTFDQFPEATSSLEIPFSANTAYLDDGISLASSVVVYQDVDLFSGTNTWPPSNNVWNATLDGTQLAFDGSLQAFEHFMNEDLDMNSALPDTSGQNWNLSHFDDYANEVPVPYHGHWNDLSQDKMLSDLDNSMIQSTIVEPGHQFEPRQNPLNYTLFQQNPSTGFEDNDTLTTSPQPIPIFAPNLSHMAPAQVQQQPTAPTAAGKACTHPGCTCTFARDFERTRHESSVHGMNQKLHYCHVVGCFKHAARAGMRGYTRRDKLAEHLWKKHADLGFVKRVV